MIPISHSIFRYPWELEVQFDWGTGVGSAAGVDTAHAQKEQETLPRRQKPIPRAGESVQLLAQK